MRKTLVALLVSALPAFSQGFRYDSNAYTISGTPPPGAMAPVLAVPGASIALCSNASCTIAATAYTDITLATACPAGSPITLPGSVSCVQTTAQTGAFGFWLIAGVPYYYAVTFPNGVSYGPYSITTGNSPGYAIDMSYPTLAAGCEAAGLSGTLAITKHWLAVPAQTLGCNLLFYGGGQIQPAASATVVVSGTISAPPAQQIFDVSLSSALVNVSGAVPMQYSAWWGQTSAAAANACASSLLPAAGSALVVNAPLFNVASQRFNCALTFVPGGLLQAASGATLTILNSSLTAPVAQIFDQTRGGSIEFSPGSPSENIPLVYAEWWGAKRNGTTDDSNALRAAVRAMLLTGTPVQLLPGTYAANTPVSGAVLDINSTTGATIKGAGSGVTTISTTAAGADTLAAVSGSFANPIYNLSGFTLRGPDGTCSSQTSGNGLNISGSATALLRIRDVKSTGFCGSGKSAFNIGNAEDGQLDSITAQYSDRGLNLIGASNGTTINNLLASLNNTYNAYIASTSVTCNSCVIQSGVKTCLHMDGVDSDTFNSLFLENCNTSGTSGVYALELHSVSNTWFSGCHLNDTHGVAIYLSGTGHGNVIGCRITGEASASNIVSISASTAAGNTWVGVGPVSFGGSFGGSREVSISAFDGNAGFGLNGNIYAANLNTPLNPVTTCSGTCPIDLTQGTYIEVTLSANSTLSVTNFDTASRQVCFDIIENGTGGYTWTWQTGVIIGGMSITTTAGFHNLQCFTQGSDMKLRSTGAGASTSR